MNLLGVNDVVLPYEIVDQAEHAGERVEKEPREYPEDFFNGDGYYERQYWFRNPIIKLNHYDGEPEDSNIFDTPNPYGVDPFV